MAEEKDQEPYTLILKFADSKIPVFKETASKDYVMYGLDNRYPEYLTYLFDKSPKHGAILAGKAFYVYGEGFPNGDIIINRTGDTLNDITKKAALDIEIYGGYRQEIIFNALGKVCEVYHVDYTTLRKAKGPGFYYRENWPLNSRDCGELIPEFDPSKPVGTQIYAYNEYRPMTRWYPLPSYIAANNYIETDIEISKFHLSAIRNGFMPSKMIQFFKGEPTEDKKRAIEKRMAQKFSGSENAGKFLLVFNESNATKSVQVDDLSASELDKQFDLLNKTCQQEVFSGHRVTSPMLFGIKTEGQLGGNTELYTAYAIFQNTYSKPKATALSKEIEYVLGFSNYKGDYDLLPTDPIGVQFDVKDVINALPKEFVFNKLNIPLEMWDKENIGSDNKPTPTVPLPPSTDVGTPLESELATNPHLKNLSPKQYQQVLRVRRDYQKGRIDQNMAMMMLRQSLGLSDNDIKAMLGAVPAAMGSQDELDGIVAMFDECGESKNDFQVIKSKPVPFQTVMEAEFDEEIYIKEAFKTYDVTLTESQIIDLIKKDKLITPEVIARTLGQTVAYVQSKIDNLIAKGYINQNTKDDGIDTLIERVISPDITAPPTTIDKTPASKISIMYSYEGPQDSRNRPFCARMMELNRFYTRADIEKLSLRLGYSVFDRRGGFWTRKGTHDTTPYCRHIWKSNITVRK